VRAPALVRVGTDTSVVASIGRPSAVTVIVVVVTTSLS